MISLPDHYYETLNSRASMALAECPYDFRESPVVDAPPLFPVLSQEDHLQRAFDCILYYGYQGEGVIGILHGVSFCMLRSHCSFRTLFRGNDLTWDLHLSNPWCLRDVCAFITNFYWLKQAMRNLEYFPEEIHQELMILHNKCHYAAQWHDFSISGGLLTGSLQFSGRTQYFRIPIYLYELGDEKDLFIYYKMVVRDALFDCVIPRNLWDRVCEWFGDCRASSSEAEFYVLNWCARNPTVAIRQRIYRKTVQFLYDFYQKTVDNVWENMVMNHSMYFFTISPAMCGLFNRSFPKETLHVIHSVEDLHRQTKPLWNASFTKQKG